MQLKPFIAKVYDDTHVIIKNIENDHQGLFTEEEYEIVKFLKSNESETLLALLLPNIGIAKKDHIVLCLTVLGKLKKVGIVDYFSITGRVSESSTSTIEISASDLGNVKLHGLRSFAVTLFGLSDKVFGGMGAIPLFAVAAILSVFGVMVFPFFGKDPFFESEEFFYIRNIGLIYVVACVSLCVRSLLQSAFLKGLRGQSTNHDFKFFGPFIGLHCNLENINLTGVQNRVLMRIIGIMAPLMLGSFFSIITAREILSPQLGLIVFSTFVGMSMLFICPLISFDGADILHVLFDRTELKETFSTRLREVFQTKGALSKQMLGGLIVTLFWMLIWLDFLRSYWELLIGKVVVDLTNGKSLSTQIFASLFLFVFVLLVITPALIFVYHFAMEKFKKKKRMIVVDKNKVQDSLAFEDRMKALENTPLFASLPHSDRVSFISEMEVKFYPDGQYLVQQGEGGDEFLLLAKGKALAFFTDVLGKNHFLAKVQEGDAFGEIALIDEVPRTASIISDGGCIALSLNKDRFNQFPTALGSTEKLKVTIRLTSFFNRHPLFSKLSARDKAELIESFSFESLNAGDEIRDPESDDSFYLIYSGEIRVDTGDDSSEILLGPDDSFGYANQLNAKYFAKEPSGILKVKENEFHSLIWEKLVSRPELFV